MKAHPKVRCPSMGPHLKVRQLRARSASFQQGGFAPKGPRFRAHRIDVNAFAGLATAPQDEWTIQTKRTALKLGGPVPEMYGVFNVGFAIRCAVQRDARRSY